MNVRILVSWLAFVLVVGGAPQARSQPGMPASAPVTEASAPASALSKDLPLRRDPAGQPMGDGTWGAWAIVLLAALGGLWVVRKALGGAGMGWPVRQLASPAARSPRVVASRALSAQSSIQVVEWNGRELLLGCTAHSITVLDIREVEKTEAEGLGS